MKKLIFTLMMMAGLTLVAGTAMGQNASQVYPEGEYNYSLTGVSVTTANTTGAAITFSGFDTAPTITNFDPSVGTSAAAVTFTLTYATGETPDTGNKIIVTITDGGTSACTNYIEFAIEVLSPPTMTIAITGNTGGGCQNLNASPVNNTDASQGADLNNVTYTVEVSSSPSGLDSYSYDFALSGMGTTLSETVTAVTTHTDTFTSTEGDGGTITAAISNATFTMDAANGGGTYDITVTSGNEDITINPLPTIGAFN